MVWDLLEFVEVIVKGGCGVINIYVNSELKVYIKYIWRGFKNIILFYKFFMEGK